MNIVVLVEKIGKTTHDLLRAAEPLGVALTPARWSDLSAEASNDGERITAGGVALHEADAVLLRTMSAAAFEQVFLRLDVLHRLEALGVRVVNPPRAVEISCDKHLSLAILRAAGLNTPRTFACQRYVDAMGAFDALGGDVVVKPLFGAEGFGVMRITDRVLAQRAFNQLERTGAVAYIQQFIPHGDTDLRLFVIGDEVAAAMRRHGADWRCNIALGGRGESIVPEPELRALALRAARACRALIAGVDIVLAEDGTPFALEVNAIPGWKALAEVTGIDIAAAVLQFTAQITAKNSIHA